MKNLKNIISMSSFCIMLAVFLSGCAGSNTVHSIADLDGKIIGVFVYFKGNDPTYDKIDGKWLDDEEYGVIHRIASCGKGVFSECVDWCLNQHHNIRIDTHKDNKIMQHLLSKHGFSYCGIIWLEDGSERLAYQLNNSKKLQYQII